MAVLRNIVARLGFQFNPAQLRRFNNALNQSRSSLSSIKGVALAAAGALGAVATGAMAKSLFDANVEYQKLIARLDTLEGGAAKGEAAFKQLQKFATETPFQLQEVVSAYADLKGAGFDTSEATMTALGDLATGSGKSLGDMVEILKSSGRGMASMVDNISGLSAKAEKGKLTMENLSLGIKKVVDPSDKKALLEFFTSAGKAGGVAGGMEKQMRTLGGQVSNLKDGFFKFMVAVGDAGFRDAMGELMTALSGGLKGGDSFATLLGGALATGIRLVTKGLQFLIDNWKTVSAVLAVVGTMMAAVKFAVFIAGLGGIKAALLAAGAAAAPFLLVLAKVVLPVMAAVGALIALGLIIEDISHYFKGSPSLIGKFIAKFKEAPGPLGALARFAETALAGVQDLIGHLISLGSSLASTVWPILEGFGALFVGIFNDIKAAVSTFFADLGGGADSSGDTVTTVFEAIKTIASVVFTVMGVWLKVWLTVVLTVWELIWTVFSTFVGLIYSYWKTIISLLGPPIMAFLGVVVGAWQAWWTAVKTIFYLLSDLWSAIWGALSPVVMPIIDTIKSALSDFWESIKEGAGTIMESLAPAFDWMSDTWDKVMAGLTAGFTAFLDLIMQAGDAIAELTGVDLEGIKAKVASAQARASGLTSAGAVGGAAANAQAGGAGQPSTVTNTATGTVGAVNVNVTQTNADPNAIGNAARSGLGQGLQETLGNAQRSMAGGVS